MGRIILLLAGVVVTLAIFGLISGSETENYSLSPSAISTDAESSTVRHIVPQTYVADQYTTSVSSDRFTGNVVDDMSSLELPDLIQDADAVDDEEIEITEYRVGSDTSRKYAIDSDGNIFSHGHYKISRIDVSDDRQTIWTMPEGWKTNHVDPTVDSDNFYYFGANSNLTAFDHNTGEFTEWDVAPSNRLVALNGINFSPSHTTYLHEQNLNVTGIYISPKHFRIYGEGGSGIVDVEIVSPSGDVLKTTVKGDVTGSISKTLNLPSGLDIEGIWTVSVSNFLQSDTTTFNVASYNRIYGNHNEELSTAPPLVFLQHLNPEDGMLTTFHYPSDDKCIDLIGSESDKLYFLTAKEDNDETVYGIVEFSPSTTTITSWPEIFVDDYNHHCFYRDFDWYSLNDIAFSDDKLYLGLHSGRHTLDIYELDTTENTVNRVSVPFRCTGDMKEMDNDSAGTVFFNGCDGNFHKFEPATDTFTKFNTGIGEDLLYIDDSDNIYWADGRRAGTIQLVEDSERLTVTISSQDVANNMSAEGDVTLDITFSSPVYYFNVYDINFEGNAEIYGGTGNYDNYYTEKYSAESYGLHIFPQTNGALTISIDAGVVQTDAGQRNIESNTYTVIFENIPESIPELG